MDKRWKIAVVVGLVAAVAVAIVSKQRWLSSAADETKTAVSAAETPRPAAGLPRLLDLGSVSCIPCKMMAPILEELKEKYAGRLDVQFIDVWKDPDAGRQYGIKLIPTQIFLAPDGKELWRHEGFLGKEEILAKWKELGVDLSARRATGPRDEGMRGDVGVR
jgi:thioredoxin 1